MRTVPPAEPFNIRAHDESHEDTPGMSTGFNYEDTTTWYDPWVHGIWETDSYFIPDTIVVIPFWAGQPIHADRMGINVITAGAAGCVVHLGIWLGDASGMCPGTLLCDAGTMPVDAGHAGLVKWTIDVDLPGTSWLWLGGAAQVTGAPIVDGWTTSVGEGATIHGWWPFGSAPSADPPANAAGVIGFELSENGAGDMPPEVGGIASCTRTNFVPMIELRGGLI